MTTTVLSNCTIFDGVSDTLVEGGYLAYEDGVIKEVGKGKPKLKGATVIDAGKRFVMPGLLDLHFHAYGISLNMNLVDNMPVSTKAAHAARLLNGALHRGFTTVRDPGGGEIGLHLSIQQNLFEGPRFYYGGKALSQTGGHGDMRPAHQPEGPCGCTANQTFSEVVDGVENVRRFCRNELRKGADHIKVFISGGVASPTDPIWMPQYTDEEIGAAVYEAKSRRKYVVAHCHTDDGARRCIKNGVRSIDHCTMITEETAKLIAAADGKTFAVPTLAIIENIMAHGPELGMFGESLEKLRQAHAGAYKSLEYLYKAGARVGLGTDLFEERFHPWQSREFEFRAGIMKPIDILKSATSINAEIMQKKGQLGVLAPGAFADYIVIDGNPVKDIKLMGDPARNFAAIVKGGVAIRSRLH